MPAQQPTICIVTPCYNEGSVVVQFLERLVEVVMPLPFSFRIIVVDDCSTDNTRVLLQQFNCRADNAVLEVISLPANKGHQVAIYEGLKAATIQIADHVIIMDADGQDTPEVIPVLLAKRDADIVHVVREQRSESVFFRAAYIGYQWLFKISTGRKMDYGNFCLISRQILELAVSKGFHHFAAFLARQPVNKQFVPAAREKRIGGRSKMNFGKLVRHALASITEYWNISIISRQLPVLITAILVSNGY